jgi:hypothetical protein
VEEEESARWRKRSTLRGTGYTKVLWAQKHDIFEELKEVHLGQSVGRTLRQDWREYSE